MNLLLLWIAESLLVSSVSSGKFQIVQITVIIEVIFLKDFIDDVYQRERERE